MILVAIFFWAVIFYLSIDGNTSIKNRVLIGSLAFLVSVSLISFLFFLSMVVKLNFQAFQIILTTIPALFLISRIFIKQRLFFNTKKERNAPSNAALIVFFSAFIIFSWLYFNSTSRWGSWDAWAIWSLKAKFFLFDNEFARMFKNIIGYSHPDYPLMLASANALLWKSFGTQSPVVPLLTAYVFGLLVLIVAITSFIEKSQIAMAIIVLAIFSTTELIYPFASLQTSDTLLSLFILVSVVLYHHLHENENKLLPCLIGFFAAATGWIKNEGILFFLVFSFFFFIFQLQNKKKILGYFSGAVIPALIIVFFKIFYAPGNDLIVRQNEASVFKLIDPSRYITTMKFFLNYTMNSASVMILISIIGVSFYRYYKTFSFAVIMVMIAGYFFIYILTPQDLVWHLETSFDRLLHQLTPALVFSVFAQIGQSTALTKFKVINV